MFRKNKNQNTIVNENEQFAAGLIDISKQIEIVKNMINGKFSESEIEAKIKKLTDEFCALINRFFSGGTMSEIMMLLLSGSVSEKFAYEILEKVNETYNGIYNKNFNDYADFKQQIKENKENEQAQPQNE